MHSADDSSADRRTHCPGCGSRKAKRWGERRLTLTKFCPNDSCSLFGVPYLVAVGTVVTIDRDGRQRVTQRELAASSYEEMPASA